MPDAHQLQDKSINYEESNQHHPVAESTADISTCKRKHSRRWHARAGLVRQRKSILDRLRHLMEPREG